MMRKAPFKATLLCALIGFAPVGHAQSCEGVGYTYSPIKKSEANLIVTDGQGGIKPQITGPGTRQRVLARVTKMVGEFHENFHIERFYQCASQNARDKISSVSEVGYPIKILSKIALYTEEADAYSAEAAFINSILNDGEQRQDYSYRERRWLRRQAENARRSAITFTRLANEERARRLKVAAE